MRVLIDTSILIDHLRGGNKWEKFLSSVEKNTELFIPTIVLFELFSGKSTKDFHISQKILNLLNFFQKIDLDENIAKKAGEIYRDVSKTIQIPDYVIAASAMEINASVVTLNVKHFQQIPGLAVYPLD